MSLRHKSNYASIVGNSGLAAKYDILAQFGGEISMIIRFSHIQKTDLNPDLIKQKNITWKKNPNKQIHFLFYEKYQTFK